MYYANLRPKENIIEDAHKLSDSSRIKVFPECYENIKTGILILFEKPTGDDV